MRWEGDGFVGLSLERWGNLLSPSKRCRIRSGTR